MYPESAGHKPTGKDSPEFKKRLAELDGDLKKTTLTDLLRPGEPVEDEENEGGQSQATQELLENEALFEAGDEAIRELLERGILDPNMPAKELPAFFKYQLGEIEKEKRKRGLD